MIFKHSDKTDKIIYLLSINLEIYSNYCILYNYQIKAILTVNFSAPLISLKMGTY